MLYAVTLPTRRMRGALVFAILAWSCMSLLSAQWTNFDRDSLEQLLDPTVYDTVQLARNEQLASTWMLSTKALPYLHRMDTILKVLEDEHDPRTRYLVQYHRSAYLYFTGYHAKFRRDFRKAQRSFSAWFELHPYRTTPDIRTSYHQTLGILYRAAGATDLAIRELHAAIELAHTDAPDSAMRLTPYHVVLAGVHADRGEFGSAEDLLARCDTTASLFRARVFAERSHLADLRGDLSVAIDLLERGDMPDDAWENPWDRLNILVPLARLRLKQGDANAAMTAALECLRLAREVGDEAAECGCQTLLGRTLMALGDLKGAERELGEALSLAQTHKYVGLSRETGDDGSLVNITGTLKDLYQMQGRVQDALDMTLRWVGARDTVERMMDREDILRQQLHLELVTDSLKRAEEIMKRDMAHAHALKEERIQRYTVAIGALLLVLALTGTTLFIHNKRRQEKKLALLERARLQQEKVIAELRIRDQVGRDLHDDMGAGLSAMRLKSELAQRQLNDPAARSRLAELSELSDELMSNMRHIIWALTSDRGSVDDTVAHCVNHACTYLGEHGIAVQIDQPAQWPNVDLDPQHRRNLFLVLKEALHNVVKHAHAERVHITFAWNGGLFMSIMDNGQGSNGHAQNQRGNGLRNMRRRMEDLGGTFVIRSDGGTSITCHLPHAH